MELRLSQMWSTIQAQRDLNGALETSVRISQKIQMQILRQNFFAKVHLENALDTRPQICVAVIIIFVYSNVKF